jgi:hypothetical protein
MLIELSILRLYKYSIRIIFAIFFTKMLCNLPLFSENILFRFMKKAFKLILNRINLNKITLHYYKVFASFIIII